MVFAPEYSVGLLEQEPQLDPDKTVKEIVEIAQANDLPIKMEVTSTTQKREANYLSLNIKKAKNKLDWIKELI